MDKALFKDLMAAHGVPQVDYAVVRDGERAQLDFAPARLREARAAGLLGRDLEGVGEAGARPARSSWPSSTTRSWWWSAWPTGMEVECSVLGNGDPEASTPGEIVVQTGDWYDYEAKYTDGGMELVVPARTAHARGGAAPGGRGLSRSWAARGWRGSTSSSTEDGVLVNELNTIPGFTATSVYAKLWEASGLAYPELLDRLLALALERHEAERRYRH